MQKKWNIIAILAVLLFASVAVAADETKPGAVPGYKFCMKRVSGVWTLSQQPESHEADYWSSESCYDLWYDADHHTSSELVHANSYYDAYSEVSIRLSDGDLVKLGSDLDFGGMNADNSACVAAFRPLAGLKGLVFNGDNHTIKNLCFIQKKTDLITTNIGFFSKVEGADAGVTDITFENVYFQTSYGPVAGVVAGMVTGASSFSNITLKNVKVDAATAGGVVGECGENVNSKGRPVFKNIVGKKVEVLTSTNVVPAYDYEYNGPIYEIYLGGLVGNASWGISVTDVSITDLNVHSEVYSIEMIYQDETSSIQTLNVALGGLVGSSVARTNSEDEINAGINNGIDVDNAYTIGNISAPFQCDRKNENTCKVGFVAGVVNAYTADGGKKIFIGNNYHYGKSDYMARNVVGELSVNSIDVSDLWTKENSSTGLHVLQGGVNYRNAVAVKGRDTLRAMASMDTAYYNSSENIYGGYLDESAMKKDAFAAVLNNNGSRDASRWSRKASVNDGFPVFATEGLNPIYRIEFYGEGEYAQNASAAERKKWTDAGGSVTSTQNGTFMNISAVTDYTGKLGNSTWQSNAASIGSGDYYWSYYDEQSGKVSGLVIDKSTVFHSSMSLNLRERVSVTVVHGFVDYGNNSAQFFPVEEFAKQSGKNYYFLGVPASKINSDSAWVRVPYLAVDGESGYEYYGYSFEKKICSASGGEERCSFNTLENAGSGSFYVDALVESNPEYGIASGDTLYVVYTQEPLPTEIGAGGRLFVSDLHGEGFDQDVASVQMTGVTSGSLTPFGSSVNLSIPTWNSSEIIQMLNELEGFAAELPYSPYLKADYPSSFWNNVRGVVALVAVGGSSDGGSHMADELLRMAAQELSRVGLNHPFLKDTVSALGSPLEIRAQMDPQISQNSSLVYARYVRLGQDGSLDLTNLLAAIASVQSYGADFPVYVGLIPQLVGMEYHVTFDLTISRFGDDDYSTLFVTDAWLNNKGIPDSTYTEDVGSQPLISEYGWRIFRTDGCYNEKWIASDLTADYRAELRSISDLEEEDFPFKVNKDGSRSLTVYPNWGEGGDPSVCNSLWPRRTKQNQETGEMQWNNTIVRDYSEGGNIVLQQVWNGVTLRHMSTSLPEGVTGIYLPYADSLAYTFEVYADGFAGYELDGKIKLTWEDSDNEPTLLNEGDTVHVLSWYEGGMEFYAEYTYKKFNINFVSGKKDVLYGENSDSVGVYRIESEEDALDLPRWVYTEDNCVDGWMLYSKYEDKDPYSVNFTGNDEEDDESNSDVPEDDPMTFDAFDYFLSVELDMQNGKRLEKYPLYARWADARTCVKDLGYKQARLEVAENGLVEFKELRKDSKGKVVATQVHKFAKDSTMLLPAGVDGSNFIVQGAPAKGYVLDSLVMTLDGKKYVYHEGDTLSGDIAMATFAAYFMPENSTPAEFAKAELLQSGSAVRFEFVTSEFGTSGASVRIVLENDDGKKVVDSVLAVTKTPYTGSWEYYPLRAGNYLLTATVKNSKTSDLFEKDFEVKATIASKQDGWRMLSLSNVIMDSVIWDDDVRFYWWDDSRNYGSFWRYQRLMDDDEVNSLTGYWYSSLKGRPLVMREDMSSPKAPVVWNMDSVYTGWNMVANPYGWYVDLYGENPDKKKSGTEESDVEFWSWNDSLGAYEEVDVVGPYEAVWAKVKGPSQWKLPSKPAFVATVDENGNDSLNKPLKKTVELASNSKNSWAIRAVLRDGKGKSDSWNIMGVSELGWASEEPPSGMGDHVNLSIKDGKRSLAKSFKKASGDSYEWTVSLDASGDRAGYLHFEGLETLRASGLKVFVTVDGITTQMAENDTLKVAIGSLAKTATVRVAPSARTIVAQKLNGLRAFQAGNSLQVGFQVSESLAGARAYVEILDMKGKVLSSASGTAVSGSNAMTLQAPKSGLYMVRVRVGGKQAAGSVAVK